MAGQIFKHEGKTYRVWFEVGVQFACLVVGSPCSDDYTYILKSVAIAEINEAKLKKVLGL